MVGDRLQLGIHDLHPQGAGVGQHASYGRIYVPFTFPGEQVEIELTDQPRKGQWNARRLSRPQGDCRVAGECGGCSWPATAYDEQLRWKEKLFKRSIAVLPELAGIAPEVHGNCGNLGFRSRVHLHANFYSGRLNFGFYARGERRLVAIDDCPVAEEPIRRVIAELSASSDAVWPHEDFGFGIELTHLAEEGIVLLVLYGAPRRRAALAAALPEFSALPSAPDAMLAFAGEAPTYAWQRFGALTLFTRPGCFQQVNRKQSDKVRSLIAQRLAGFADAVFFDLYSGSGNYSLPLHRQVKHIWGCDDNPVGIEVATHNVTVNGISNATYVCADAAQLMQDPQRFGFPARADFVLCDPARFGMAKELPQLIAKTRPREFVLVSNNTVAFVKDTRALIRAGFTAVKIDLVDFFPNTPYWNVVSVWRL